MSQRAFKYYTIATTGTPQPLVGTTLTASVNAPTPSTSHLPITDQVTKLAVADSSMFLNGDWVILGSTGAGDEERVICQSVVDSTHITVKGMANNHASAEFVRLAILINSVYIQSLDGNSGNLYVGTSSAMDGGGTTGLYNIAKLVKVAANVQPIELSSTRSGLANADDLGQLWIAGTNPDKYLPSVGQV